MYNNDQLLELYHEFEEGTLGDEIKRFADFIMFRTGDFFFTIECEEL